MNLFWPKAKLFLIMFILWLLFSLSFDLQTIITGMVISFFVAWFTHDILHDKKGSHFKGIPFYRLIVYFFVLFVEIFKAAFIYSINLFKRNYEPVVFKLNLEKLDPVKVAIVANSITLTPGTISVEMVDQVIYVMVLADPNTPHEELERPIRERFEKLLLIKEDN